MGFFDPDDDYLIHNAVWVAKIESGGEIASCYEYQDPCWGTFKKFVEQNGYKVVGLSLKFRSHEVSLPNNTDGYICVNGVAGDMTTGQNFSFKKIGYVFDGKITLLQYRTPTLEFMEQETKDVKDYAHMIVWNK